jgi:thermostable 8-oxoguanine DNA glycosylase
MEAVLNKPFNSAQIELIQLLAQDLDNRELMELRKILVAFRFRLVEERAERIAHAKGWSDEQINQMSQEHLRTPYRAKQKALAQNKQNGKH